LLASRIDCGWFTQVDIELVRNLIIVLKEEVLKWLAFGRSDCWRFA
jgi:hypothetical protein